MANQWFYSKDGNEFGPISTGELQKLAASGELKPSDLIRKAGTSNQVPASRIKGFMPSVEVVPTISPVSSAMVMCPKCSGVGIVKCPNCSGNGNCPTCSGVGATTCQVCDRSGTVKCPQCHGKKKPECSKCHGRGTRTFTDYAIGGSKAKLGGGAIVKTEQCLACQGTGYLNEPCSRCDGKGNVSCATCGGKVTQNCSECAGKRICHHCHGIKNVRCSLCEGQGTVSKEKSDSYYLKKVVTVLGCLGTLTAMVFLVIGFVPSCRSRMENEVEVSNQPATASEANEESEKTPQTKVSAKAEEISPTVVPKIDQDIWSKSVSLKPPYQGQTGASNERLTLQYAVMAILQQVGLKYDFAGSLRNAKQECTTYVNPRFENQPCRDALDELLAPFQLTYEVDGETVTLKRK